MNGEPNNLCEPCILNPRCEYAFEEEQEIAMFFFCLSLCLRSWSSFFPVSSPSMPHDQYFLLSIIKFSSIPHFLQYTYLSSALRFSLLSFLLMNMMGNLTSETKSENYMDFYVPFNCSQAGHLFFIVHPKAANPHRTFFRPFSFPPFLYQRQHS